MSNIKVYGELSTQKLKKNERKEEEIFSADLKLKSWVCANEGSKGANKSTLGLYII